MSVDFKSNMNKAKADMKAAITKEQSTAKTAKVPTRKAKAFSKAAAQAGAPASKAAPRPSCGRTATCLASRRHALHLLEINCS
jgi:hypothetical protein